MRIVIATDAWKPQINGVVTTLGKTKANLEALGHEVLLLTPALFKTIPCPTYRSIRLALRPGKKVNQLLDEFEPQAVHVATEGPVGLAVRRYCLRHGLKFTTSYHTQFPQYIRMRAPVPLGLSYAYLRWFHKPAVRTMVPTESQRRELLKWGFDNVVIWTRGVDTELFRPGDKSLLRDPRPISMYMGRIAMEKNIEAFLELNLPGTRYVVGDGPDLPRLREKYPSARFTGFLENADLARYLAAADVFVFPSRTDTFGVVLLEAMACGTPVAAFPVTGPVDVVQNGATGVLDEDLRKAVLAALEVDGRACRDFALQRTWRAATEQFLGHLEINQNGNPVASPADTKSQGPKGIGYRRNAAGGLRSTVPDQPK